MTHLTLDGKIWRLVLEGMAVVDLRWTQNVGLYCVGF